MDQMMNFVKLNEFNLLKKEIEEYGLQRKNLDNQNRRLEHTVEILNDSNVCECIIALYFFNVNK